MSQNSPTARCQTSRRRQGTILLYIINGDYRSYSLAIYVDIIGFGYRGIYNHACDMVVSEKWYIIGINRYTLLTCSLDSIGNMMMMMLMMTMMMMTMMMINHQTSR